MLPAGPDFVAIDWETANAFRGSPCAVGIVEVRGGEVVDIFETLLRPPERYAHFNDGNVAVHGLRPADVALAPRFADEWAAIERRLAGLPVVAHNAEFDLGVVQDATWAEGIRPPSLTFGCTLLLARRHYVLPSYSLDSVAAAAGVRLERHHDALADALAAAEILLAVARDVETTTLSDTFDAHGLELGSFGGRGAHACRPHGGPARWVPGAATPAMVVPTLF